MNDGRMSVKLAAPMSSNGWILALMARAVSGFGYLGVPVAFA